ncbi:hypothetical protein AU510_15375 [Lonsdalea britannica]|nr:hypothetical protein AU510_15375 [Lonsdalea britannica]
MWDYTGASLEKKRRVTFRRRLSRAWPSLLAFRPPETRSGQVRIGPMRGLKKDDVTARKSRSPFDKSPEL